ncbi:MAG: SPOR domain-containing protein [Campylobacterales bacterium]|nr:SPOR domain-containing protein [Campylobacterales bacterium]
MEEKNELNDILLQADDDKNNKGNMLLVVAAVLIIFFLGVIGYKIVSDTSGQKLPTKVNTSAKSDDFSKVPMKQTKDTVPTGKDPIEAKKEEEFNKKLAEIKAKYQQDTKKAETKKTVTPPPPALPVETKVPTEKPKPVVKTEQKKKPVVKPKPKPKQTTKTTKSKGSYNYYVQLGSFKKKPSKDMLKTISKKGFKYRLKKVNVKGATYTRLYVGPYKNKTEAKAWQKKIEKRLKVTNTLVKKD